MGFSRNGYEPKKSSNPDQSRRRLRINRFSAFFPFSHSHNSRSDPLCGFAANSTSLFEKQEVVASYICHNVVTNTDTLQYQQERIVVIGEQRLWMTQ